MDSYKRLAKRLDKLTNGYPATESGIELRILKKLFTDDDVKVALKLRPMPELASGIALRCNMTTEEMQEKLDDMANRGLIFSVGSKTGQHYALAPFVLGFWEFQVDHLDTELCDMFDEYADILVNAVGGHKPALTRVVPLNASIDADLQVLSHEDMKDIMSNANSFQLFDCICRKKKDLQESRTCNHELERCMVFYKEETAFDHFNFAGRVVEREEALEVLEKAEKEGLVHCTYNAQSNLVWVCNCCKCCCDLMVGLNEYHSPHLVVRSNYMAVIDEELCLACGKCTRKCPTEAIKSAGEVFAVDTERCIGCGVCVAPCPENAIAMVQRPEEELTTPPADMVKWFVTRSANRMVDAAKNVITGK